MTTPLTLGPQLPTFDWSGQGLPHPAVSARAAEDLGFEAAWVGDHLAFRPPWLDSLLALAAGFTSTNHIQLGTSVLLTALREPAWVGKQVGTLQFLGGDRLILGVGVGGENPEEWEAVGVPVSERFARTDALLRALPEMLSGRPTMVTEPYMRPVPTMRPSATLPPLWVGGRADGALRRAARFADGWMGAFVEPSGLTERRDRLAEHADAAGRPQVRLGMSVFVHITSDKSAGERAARAFFDGLYGLDFEQVRRFCVIGEVDEVTTFLEGYVAKGVDTFVIVSMDAEPLTQFERLALVREQLTGE